MKEPAIVVEGVSKKFRIPHERYTSLKQNAIHLLSKKSYTEFEAVNDVNFTVNQGEFFGIVGRNGSGKSTLLKMLAGIYVPSGGKIQVHGTLSPFIELGVGFNMELTARENIFLSGAILGLTRKQIEEKFQEIIEFAELEQFVDQKLKNYSSGMQVRLAFSIAVQAHSDILLIDEVLAVGDVSFQEKCFDVFRRMKKQGKTIVFVTHDMGSVREFCDRVLIIDNGTQLNIASPEKAADVYARLNAEASAEFAVEEAKKQTGEDFGSGQVTIESLEFFAEGSDKPTRVLESLRPFRLRINYKNHHNIKEAAFGFALHLPEGTTITGPNTLAEKAQDIKASGYIEYSGICPLLPGNYKASVGIFETTGKSKATYDYKDKAYSFTVQNNSLTTQGLVDIGGSWKRD